jgi:alpha-galactosidase
MGGDLTLSDAASIALLQNDEALHLTLHSAGARQLARTDCEAVWTTRDEEGRAYAALFNLSDAPRTVSVRADALGAHGDTLYDVWTHRPAGRAQDVVSASLAPHASVLYRLD